MVEVELEFHILAVDTLVTRELKLLDEVLVGKLRETSAFIGVKIDVIYVERRVLEGGDAESVGSAEVEATVTEGVGGDVEFVLLAELEVDLDLVVLEGDQRKSKAGVAVA